MYDECLAKQKAIKDLFSSCPTPEAKYQKIIELGRALSPLNKKDKSAENQVKGCQSIMYLHSYWSNGKIFFEAESDALISSGLAALLIKVYSGETAETILKCPPTYIDELGISTSLTPNRANGLYNIHLRMKQDALKLFMSHNKA